MDVLITGGSRGIGFGIARELAASGHRLMLVSRNSKRIGDASRKLDAEHPGLVFSHACDVAESEAIEALAAHCTKLNFTPGCLVVNAGIFIEGTLSDAPERDLQETMRVDFLAAYRLVRQFLPQLKASESGRVILIGSTAAYEPYPVGALYGVAKWALRGLAVNLRRELIPANVGVTFLAPGGTLTDLWENEQLPPKRLLDPSDIGKLVAVCLSLSSQAVVEELIVRPMLGDIHE
ncbi:MAG: SDR family oxidoreductase [Xanthomonadaceae bacterium]|nr:SDR family oxidoreductase [Xanthomonadaceae bacterium]